MRLHHRFGDFPLSYHTLHLLYGVLQKARSQPDYGVVCYDTHELSAREWPAKGLDMIKGSTGIPSQLRTCGRSFPLGRLPYAEENTALYYPVTSSYSLQDLMD